MGHRGIGKRSERNEIWKQVEIDLWRMKRGVEGICKGCAWGEGVLLATFARQVKGT